MMERKLPPRSLSLVLNEKKQLIKTSIIVPYFISTIECFFYFKEAVATLEVAAMAMAVVTAVAAATTARAGEAKVDTVTLMVSEH